MPGTGPSVRDRENTQQCKVTFLTIAYISPAFSYETFQPVLTAQDIICDIKGGHNFEVYTIYNCHVM